MSTTDTPDLPTVNAFLWDIGVGAADFAPIDSPPGRDWGGQTYRVTFTRPDGRTLAATFTDSARNAETGDRSSTADVFDCIVSDAAAAEGVKSPGELAREFGIEDVDGAIAAYAAVKAAAVDLRAFLSPDEYETALYGMERL